MMVSTALVAETIDELMQVSLAEPQFLTHRHGIDAWLEKNINWLVDYITFTDQDVEDTYHDSGYREPCKVIYFTILTDIWVTYSDDPYFPAIRGLLNKHMVTYACDWK